MQSLDMPYLLSLNSVYEAVCKVVPSITQIACLILQILPQSNLDTKESYKRMLTDIYQISEKVTTQLNQWFDLNTSDHMSIIDTSRALAKDILKTNYLLSIANSELNLPALKEFARP